MHFPNYTFPTDRNSIVSRIESIDPLLYGRDRNFLHGHVTMLSPYISRGYITLGEIRKSILDRGYNPLQVESFLKELAWREYFLRVWEQLGTDAIMKDIRFPQQNILNHGMPDAFLEAHTGIEAFDESIDTLYRTGYMHNHLRMYIAGTICNMSGSHWKTPSQWMYYHLLDGDIASNTCSWQWNAGSFSSKKYIAIQSNINTYTGSLQKNTFLDRTYETIWGTEVPERIRLYRPLSLTTSLPHSEDMSILNPSLPLCIYTNYWLHPNWKDDIRANRILVLSPSHFSTFPVSEKVIDFILRLAKEAIPDIHIFVGEIEELRDIYRKGSQESIFLIDHILYRDITGVTKTPYPYMVPEVDGYYPSFFAYWKRAERYVMKAV